MEYNMKALTFVLSVLFFTYSFIAHAQINPLLNDDWWRDATPQKVEMAIKKGLNVNANYGHATPLAKAAHFNSNPRNFEILIENGADVNAKLKKDSNMTALMVAIIQNPNPEVIKTLIKYGADVNAKDDHGMTPLLWAAAKTNSSEVVESLIENGADINVTHNGKTLLDYAGKNRYLKGIERRRVLKILKRRNIVEKRPLK